MTHEQAERQALLALLEAMNHVLIVEHPEAVVHRENLQQAAVALTEAK